MGQATSTTLLATTSTSSIVSSSTVYPPCPSVKLTTHTSTVTSTSTVIIATYTYSSTVPKTYITSTTSMVGTVYSPAPITAGVSSSTLSPVYVLSQAVPVKTTVTIPTSPGFTPLRCEATYKQPHPPTKTVTVYETTSDGTLVFETTTLSTTVVVPSTVYIATVTLPAVYFVTNTIQVTPTSTITRTNPTSTVYAACDANNVVADHPWGGGYIAYAFPTEPNIDVYVPSFGPTDCCALCQMNATCFGYLYLAGQEVPCGLFLLDPNGPQTCNPKYNGGKIDYSDYPVPTPTAYVGNSGCGQVQFYFD